MRSIFICGLTVLLGVMSCNKAKDIMYVEGDVEGLKKGMLYLQKIKDTVLVTIDSLRIDGDNTFAFSLPLKSPEVFYLYLDKNDGIAVNDRIRFFGEIGTITIKTTRDFFEAEAKISGSASQEKLEEYQKNMSRFNDLNLALIEAQFNARKAQDSIAADSIRKRSEKNTLRRYLYTLNFVLNNTDSYVAPYITLSEVPNAQVKYLDSIYNSLTPKVASSKYGKALKEFIAGIKAEETTD